MSLEILLLLIPLLIGGIIAAINTDGVNNTTENVEAWIRQKQSNVSKKSGWFYRYILNPMLWALVKASDWTDSYTHRGLKNGVRAASSLYLIAVWCFLLYVAFMVVLILVITAIIIYIIFKVLLSSNDTVKEGYEKGRNIYTPKKVSAMDYAGVKGKNVYSGTNWFNEELKGRIDDDGNIYKGTNWFSEEKIGRIDEDGNIFEGTTYFNEKKVGRIDEDGNLQKGTNWFNEVKTGRIDEDGNIQEGTNWFNEEKTGRTGD